MINDKNQFGLGRYIPSYIRRQIRKQSGFGCVCCGLAIATYEHIEPEFKDATEHDPAKMTYLCWGCHDRVTRGYWSKDKIKEARLKPLCVQTGKCHDAFDVASKTLTIWLGSNKLVNVETILRVDDINVLKIEPPEEENAPYRLSGVFYDENGKFLFEIIRNEWFGESNNWDIECEGGRIIIRSAPNKIALQILCMARGELAIEKMNMFFRNTEFTVHSEEFRVVAYDKSSIAVWGRAFLAGRKGCVAFSVVSRGSHPLIGGGGQINVGHHNAIKFGASEDGFIGRYLIESIPRSDFPDTAAGELLKKNWGSIKFRVPDKKDLPGRNDPCICKSGEKYKRCCGSSIR